MNISELKLNEAKIKNNSTYLSVNGIEDLGDGLFSINKFIPIKVDAVSSVYKDGDEIEIFDENRDYIGSLCVKTIDYFISVNMFTANRYIAYLADTSVNDYLTQNYKISNTYVIVKEDKICDYLDMCETAPVWGGYYHSIPSQVSIQLQGQKKVIQQIQAIKGLKFPTNIHEINSINAILEPFVFERFLKKYHQIELLSDFDIVEKIKNLNSNLYGIGQLLSEFDSKEMNKIKIIAKNRIKNILQLAQKLELVKNYEEIAFLIFQKYKKSDNPFGDDTDFNSFLSLINFNETTLKSFRSNLTGSRYNEFIINVAIYWVYRIRCSIAHKRIGEYIMTADAEDFMLYFGEPLIDEIVIQMFK